MDKFSAMRTFVRVVDAGTFTKAADSLGVPKSQVTRLVQSLEQELKTLLLNRTTRRVVPTDDGAAYYQQAIRILDEIEELESNMARVKASPRGQLRIDVSPPIANLILVPALGDFCAKYPDIQIDIGVGERPVDLVGESVDCAIRSGIVSDPSLVARRLGEVHRVMCASPSYLDRFGVPGHPSDLEGDHHRVIRYSGSGGVRRTYTLQRGKERHEIDPRTTITVNDSSTMLAAGLAGLGIARTNMFIAKPHIAAGRLKVVLPEWSSGAFPIFAVYPPNRHLSAKLRVFIDWVADVCARSLDDSAPDPTTGAPSGANESWAPAATHAKARRSSLLTGGS